MGDGTPRLFSVLLLFLLGGLSWGCRKLLGVMGCTGPSKALVQGLGLLSLMFQYKQGVPRGGGAGAVAHMGCARHQQG